MKTKRGHRNVSKSGHHKIAKYVAARKRQVSKSAGRYLNLFRWEGQ